MATSRRHPVSTLQPSLLWRYKPNVYPLAANSLMTMNRYLVLTGMKHRKGLA
jgi:hypothetical protein